MADNKNQKLLLHKIKHLENEISILNQEKNEFESKFMGLYNEMETKVRERSYLIQKQKFKLLEEVKKREITEDNLREILKEKNYLFKELHHRVKNNLQMISSILNLQIKDSENDEAIILLEGSRQKINSMALVHDFIYDSGTSDKIDLSEYLTFLSMEVFKTNVQHYSLHKLDLKIPKGYIAPLKISLPCGLIINELITNSLKHAFPKEKKGILTIELSQVGKNYLLKVDDDGIGMKNDQYFNNDRNLGLNLVKLLVQGQLKGKISFDGSSGTKIEIIIPKQLNDK